MEIAISGVEEETGENQTRATATPMSPCLHSNIFQNTLHQLPITFSLRV